MKPQSKNCVVIAPDWPGEKSGCQLALKSSLYLYRQLYERVNYIVVSEHDNSDKHSNNVEFFYAPIVRRKKWIRFLESLTTYTPASAIVFASKALRNRINAILLELVEQYGYVDVIYEDVPIMALHPALEKNSNIRTFTLRSQNVLVEAFSGFQHKGSFLSRLAWKLESYKIRGFELGAIASVQHTYAITNRDKRLYEEEYPGCNVDVMEMTFSKTYMQSKIATCEVSSGNNIISLGGMDLRKLDGMRWFIEDCFLRWRNEKPTSNAKLFIGGRNSEILDQQDEQVFGLGFVENEGKFMAKGQLFINPQLEGSGVKLKSLIAMMYGKCLISTTKGIEGIDAVDGEHFLLVNTSNEFTRIFELIESGVIDPVKLGENAREFVLKNYEHEEM